MAKKSPPKLMLDWQWEATRKAVTAILLAASGTRCIPTEAELPRSILGLQRFTFALELYWQAQCPLEAPREVVARAAPILRIADRLAARIGPQLPDRAALDGLAADLEFISTMPTCKAQMGEVARLAGAVARVLRTVRLPGPSAGPAPPVSRRQRHPSGSSGTSAA